MHNNNNYYYCYDDDDDDNVIVFSQRLSGLLGEPLPVMLSPNGTINNRGEKEPLLKKFPKPLASSGMARKLLRGLGAVFAIFLVVAACKLASS